MATTERDLRCKTGVTLAMGYVAKSARGSEVRDGCGRCQLLAFGCWSMPPMWTSSAANQVNLLPLSIYSQPLTLNAPTYYLYNNASA